MYYYQFPNTARLSKSRVTINRINSITTSHILCKGWIKTRKIKSLSKSGCKISLIPNKCKHHALGRIIILALFKEIHSFPNWSQPTTFVDFTADYDKVHSNRNSYKCKTTMPLYIVQHNFYPMDHCSGPLL